MIEMPEKAKPQHDYSKAAQKEIPSGSGIIYLNKSACAQMMNIVFSFSNGKFKRYTEMTGEVIQEIPDGSARWVKKSDMELLIIRIMPARAIELKLISSMEESIASLRKSKRFTDADKTIAEPASASTEEYARQAESPEYKRNKRNRNVHPRHPY